jgi:hypothetical protein
VTMCSAVRTSVRGDEACPGQARMPGQHVCDGAQVSCMHRQAQRDRHGGRPRGSSSMPAHRPWQRSSHHRQQAVPVRSELTNTDIARTGPRSQPTNNRSQITRTKSPPDLADLSAPRLASPQHRARQPGRRGHLVPARSRYPDTRKRPAAVNRIQLSDRRPELWWPPDVPATLPSFAGHYGLGRAVPVNCAVRGGQAVPGYLIRSCLVRRRHWKC